MRIPTTAVKHADEGIISNAERHSLVSPIAEVTDEQNSVGLKPLQQLFVSVVPSAVKISGNRNAQIFQSSCLGWSPS